MRGKRTRNVWTPGRVLQIVKNPIYIGKPTFGKRPNDKATAGEVHYGECPRLISDELWEAAQRVLRAHQLVPKSTDRHYLLRGVIKCAHCSLTFCGAQGRPGVWWYRCGGYMRPERKGGDKRCISKAIKGREIEEAVWRDIEAYLRSPGDVVDELQAEMKGEAQAAVNAASRLTLETALAALDVRRDDALDMREHGHIDDAELARRLDKIKSEKVAIDKELASLEPEAEPLDEDLLAAIAARFDAGLTDAQRQQIVELLVRQITVHTTEDEEGQKTMRLVIEYRFPNGVRPTVTGTGSWRRRRGDGKLDDGRRRTFWVLLNQKPAQSALPRRLIHDKSARAQR